jgi:hypothetical protein
MGAGCGRSDSVRRYYGMDTAMSGDAGETQALIRRIEGAMSVR